MLMMFTNYYIFSNEDMIEQCLLFCLAFNLYINCVQNSKYMCIKYLIVSKTTHLCALSDSLIVSKTTHLCALSSTLCVLKTTFMCIKLHINCAKNHTFMCNK